MAAFIFGPVEIEIITEMIRVSIKRPASNFRVTQRCYEQLSNQVSEFLSRQVEMAPPLPPIGKSHQIEARKHCHPSEMIQCTQSQPRRK